MSLWTSLEPASATVDPGGSTTVRLRLRNTGDVVDEYRFEPVGDIAPWTIVEPQTLRLYPGTTGSVDLTFAPPRTPDATAGPNAYAVRITPTEHPEATTVPEGNLTITPFTEVRAELVPPTVKGRFRGRPKLAVDNLGNTKVTASVSGSDNGDQLSYDIHPSNVQIEPGRAAFVKGTLKPRQIIWFGSKEERPYTFAVKRSGVTPLDVEGTYVQRSFLPGWLATCLGVLLALAITFLTLWFAYQPRVTSAATELQETVVSTLPPSPSPSLEVPPSDPPAESAQPTASPTTEPESDGGGGDGGGGSGGGSGEQQKKKKPSVLPAYDIMLLNPTTKRCVVPPGSDDSQKEGTVGQLTCDEGSGRQRWNLEVKYQKQGPGGSALFQIRNVETQRCVDLGDYGSKPITSPILEFTCDGTTADNQLWWLDKQDSGNYWIRNYASNNECLDVAGYSTGGQGTNLTLFTCSNTDDQEWKIVHPSKD
ncbi:RICIN domain-containing protein [Streptomyces sp. CA-210063]|uniref:RICIN domain-containing protein n=1 Tax=Streptomyces sp. CA-210063 TaxID=2801029 RepID=UPI00214AB89B|nr:RICIN domain-containing protein [Streptomyces sp. CA-210063]UUU30755.1 RICIN domain-containing protein [Streptomyces sp. CA-210063]